MKQRQTQTQKTLAASYILTQRGVRWEWGWSGLCLLLVITKGAKARWAREAVYITWIILRGQGMGVKLSPKTMPYCLPPNIFIVCPQVTLLPPLCGV